MTLERRNASKIANRGYGRKGIERHKHRGKYKKQLVMLAGIRFFHVTMSYDPTTDPAILAQIRAHIDRSNASTTAETPTTPSYHRVADLTQSRGEPLRIAYRDIPPSEGNHYYGTILFIHGFPLTSYQFRKVLPIFAGQGYRCIAPDYRGAGDSSKPPSDYRKTTMAADLIALLDSLTITEAIHVVGVDIGGMIAFALSSRYPHRVKTVCWGECPLPGSKAYHRDMNESVRIVEQFHFVLHSIEDLPEALIAGKERLYINHFFSKQTHNLGARTEADIDVYEKAYSQPGAMTAALNLYRAFSTDAKENKDWVKQHTKSTVPTLALCGEYSRHRAETMETALDVTDYYEVELGMVENAGHYLPEENPQGFVNVVLGFLIREQDRTPRSPVPESSKGTTHIASI